MTVDIKDATGNIRFSTPINKGSKRKFTLMQEDYITLKFSLEHPVYFNLGDGIDNELGIFELIDLYKPVYNTTTGGYDYELRLDAYYWKWKNKKFFYSYDGDGLRYEIQEFMSMIVNHRKSSYKLRRRDSVTVAEIIEKFNLRENYKEI